MAEVMALCVIGRMVSEFDFEEVVEYEKEEVGREDGHGNWVMGPGKKKERFSQNSLTLPMKGGLPCRIRLRKEL